MPWSLGVPIGLSVALCGAILFYANKKFKKLSLSFMIGGLIVAVLTLLGVILFFAK